MIAALFGGALIGLAASLLWLCNGAVAGVSGILHAAVRGGEGQRDVRVLFLLGLVGSGALFGVFGGLTAHAPVTLPWVAASGLLVGLGTRVGGGCTSGHGVCGISRFSTRSIVATVTFMATGAASVFVVRHVLPTLGGGQ
jgi:uncharacterized membrane protein YedE/YeeE